MVRSSAGFTLLELVLSIAIISILGLISVPIYSAVTKRSELSIARRATVDALHQARIHAIAMANDSDWGVHMATGTITTFSGSSYAGRDTGKDVNTIINSQISITGAEDIIFSKNTSEVASPGTITLTTPQGDQEQITINEKGALSY